MKKLIPLLVIAAGAVAYNVYKNRKETIDDEKTFVVVNDSNDDSNQSGIEPVVEESVKEDSAVEESVAEEATVEEFVSEESDVIAEEVENAVESFTEELNEEDPLVDEPVKPVDEIVEAMQELQEELGTFETLSEPDEPFERPSFFHVTEEIISEPEVSVSAIETAKSESDGEVQEEILSTIVIEDDEEELDVEIELFLEEQLDIDEVASFAEEIEEQILSSILFENGEIEVETTEESIEAETAIEPEAEEATIEEDHQEEPVLIVLDESIDEVVEHEEETLNGEESAEEPVLTVLDENTNEDIHPVEEESNAEVQFEESELLVLDEEFDETELEQIVENEEDIPIVVESLIEEIAEQVEAAQDEPVEETVFIELEEEPEEMEPLQSYDTPEVDELMKTIAGQVKAADQAVEEPVVMEEEPEEIVEEVAQAEESDYLQDIRKITELYAEKVAQYNIRFPYLSSRFIDDTLKFSNQFNTEYPLGTRVAIEHHMHFNAVEDLFVFAQIIRQSGYLVKEGAEDKTLIVVREMFVDNNTILHDVFKVANQVYCLSGEYQKFRITKR